MRWNEHPHRDTTCLKCGRGIGVAEIAGSFRIISHYAVPQDGPACFASWAHAMERVGDESGA